MTKLLLLFKGHVNSKVSMARVMLWILFVFMLADEWRSLDRVLYQWEFIFMGLLTYILGGKYVFNEFVNKKPRRHKSSDEMCEDTRQEY